MDINIGIFGDSITWGANDAERGGWAERLKTHYFNTNDEVMVYNCGIPGDTTARLLKRFQAEARARKVDVIIFAIGINSARYTDTPDHFEITPAMFQNDLEELVKQANEFTQKIFFVGFTRLDEAKTMPIPWRPHLYYTNANIERYDQILREFCEQSGFPYISMQDAADPGLMEDGLHPDSSGHEAMFIKVRDVLAKHV